MKNNDGIVSASIHDSFWANFREVVRREGIPYQWKALNDQIPGASPSHCLQNFRIAGGKEKGQFYGCVFQDSDAAKWLEGAAYSLRWHPDSQLEALCDSAIDDIVSAQQSDGYLDTYYILTGIENRWTNLMDHHELYCAGHMLEAAIAYYECTGKRKLLDAMERYVDCISAAIGPEKGKKHGYPGHPEIELALMRLYDITGNQKHLQLARYFITQRGQQPLYFEEECHQHGRKCHWADGPDGFQYYQAGKPLNEQQDAEGHAVRALYLYSGMADVARETGDRQLQESCFRLWESVTHRRMYITGGVGSSAYGESFTFDYDLPNDTCYCETCASIALIFFARRMLKMKKSGEYADVMERALYNGVLSGMQLDGKKFFYVNPLEVLPEASRRDRNKSHVKCERQDWFDCACCPPNLIRLLTSLEDYIAMEDNGKLYVNLYIGGEIRSENVTLQSDTSYPWDGNVTFTCTRGSAAANAVALRIPSWCSHFDVTVNSRNAECNVIEGYAFLPVTISTGDVVTLSLSMDVEVMCANKNVREDAGKLAVTRGPLVYCLEEIDNGKSLHLLHLASTDSSAFDVEKSEELGGIVKLSSQGTREIITDNAPLYSVRHAAETENVTLHFVPYYAWGNRGSGEMTVWIRE